MQLTITKNDKNELLNRFEIIAEISEKKVPSRKEIKKNLSAKLNVGEEKIVIVKISTDFGTTKSIVRARAYDSEQDLQKNEDKHLLKRNNPKVEEKKE